MITKVKLRNYRSFVDAEAKLSPFTLVIGANGAGKSNFARVFTEFRNGKKDQSDNQVECLKKHINHQSTNQIISFTTDSEKTFGTGSSYPLREQLGQIQLFKLDPSCVGRAEPIKPGPVECDGSNIVSVLDGLKNGDREDLFDEIENQLKRYIPAVEKLSSKITKTGHKQLQVRETDIEKPFPVSELSEGTKLLLTILTIVHQEHSPDVIILEDIDRGLHPRLFSNFVESLRDLVEEKGIQIIATTHSPYMVDQFHEDEEAVLIIEKKAGESTVTNLGSRLEEGDTLEGALGDLWFGGFLGGVPTF